MSAAEPARDCPLCPRLVAFREESRAREPAWHNAPVPGFGPSSAPLLIIGLAPGLKGANRTGRPFTGDFAGQLLYATLLEYGFASGRYEARPDDSLRLTRCRIANAVRCVPPANLPLPAEIRTCNGFLASEIEAMPNLRAILALGTVAHAAGLRALGLRPSALKFTHGALLEPKPGLLFADSFHVSRYNTSTRRLTPEMFRAVIAELARRL